MKHTECTDCELSSGDCGYHFKIDGKVNYDIVALTACDKYGNCEFFKPKAKPISDLINREALKEVINDLFRSGEYDCNSVLKAIDNATAVDISGSEYFPYRTAYFNGVRDGRATARPQGEWIKVKEERMSVDMSGEIVTQYKCSKCGRVIATFPSKLADYYPFCQRCGSDMRKGGAE